VRDSSESASRLASMVTSLSHRGPDGQGSWLSADGRTGLGNTRLAVIDIPGGKQPMFSMDERLAIAFNGEVYNFTEIRNELGGLGRRFASRSDTEVVLEAYREWGAESLNRLHGMFAFAIYDLDSEVLFLARDRTGIKPLYYYDGPEGFYFGSELKAILGVQGIPRRVDLQAITDFMVLSYAIGPKTPFAGIYELKPGTWLQVSSSGVKRGRYWSWKRSPIEWDSEVATDQARKAILTSLQEHLVSDVPVGAFLSGGIDSSLLVSMLVRDLGQDVEAFTVGFGESAYDESPYAKQVAKTLGIRHRIIRLDHSEADIALVDKVLDQFDIPFGDSSAIPTYLVCKEIRKYVKVALGGDGGDEMFGGYARFWHADLAKRVGHMPKAGLAALWRGGGLFRGLLPDLYRRSRRFLRAAASCTDERLLALECYLFPEELPELFEPSFSEQLHGYVPSLARNGDRSDDPGGGEFTDVTVKTVLPGDYLRKVDMMSSAVGLEVRVPYLGEPVLEYAVKIPSRLKYSRRGNKLILRKLAERYLPKSVVEKPKAGFAIPIDSWLGRRGRDEICSLLTSPGAKIREIIRPSYVELLLRGFVGQTWDATKRSRYNTYQQVYFLWSLERWLVRWNPSL
jgi:asparagine synthase (glutamine-hydrolysing)